MKAILNLIKWFMAILLFALFAFYFWPPTTVDLEYNYPDVPSIDHGLENYIAKNESAYANIKEGNKAHIVWANDSLKNQTEYAIVYLHGFSASHEEGALAHKPIAQEYGMNLYLSRLSQHGLEGIDALGDLTAESLLASAQQAVAIGKRLGKKVILMGTSTGATVGLPIMAHDPEIHAGIFYSPNIDLFDSKTDLLTKPFGLSIAKAVVGDDYYSFSPPPGAEQFWTHKYPMEATVQLQTLLNSTMHQETFEKIKQPTLLLSYYKNEQEQDPVVSVAAIKTCYEQLGTPDDLKKYIELPDVQAHAMCSEFYSKDLAAPIDASKEFIEGVLGIEKAILEKIPTEQEVMNIQYIDQNQ